MLVATGKAGSKKCPGETAQVTDGIIYQHKTGVVSTFIINEIPCGALKIPQLHPATDTQARGGRTGKGLIKLLKSFLEESRRASKSLDFNAGVSPWHHTNCKSGYSNVS